VATLTVVTNQAYMDVQYILRRDPTSRIHPEAIFRLQ